MLLKLHEIIKIIETWSPIKFSEDFDNIGLIVGDRNSEIKKALITIDTTEKVVEEALKKKCNLIISFHPRMKSIFGAANHPRPHFSAKKMGEEEKNDIVGRRLPWRVRRGPFARFARSRPCAIGTTPKTSHDCQSRSLRSLDCEWIISNRVAHSLASLVGSRQARSARSTNPSHSNQ